MQSRFLKTDVLIQETTTFLFTSGLSFVFLALELRYFLGILRCSDFSEGVFLILRSEMTSSLSVRQRLLDSGDDDYEGWSEGFKNVSAAEGKKKKKERNLCLFSACLSSRLCKHRNKRRRETQIHQNLMKNIYPLLPLFLLPPVFFLLHSNQHAVLLIYEM